MTEFTSSSGAKVVINPAPFKEAMALKGAFARELSDGSLKIDFDFNKEIDFSAITSAVLKLDSSETVYQSLLTCLARCSYNGDKITEATFEPVSARADYYEIVISCVKENLSPFFENLISISSPFTAHIQALKEKSLKS